MQASAESDQRLPERSAHRIEWLDGARGLGIILVVFGHAIAGLIDSPAGEGLLWGRQTFFLLYTFHMPLFFLLSGLWVGDRLERDSAKFCASLLSSLVWPYFLWSIVQFTIIFMLGGLVNHPADNYWSTILHLPLQPISQFWFLHALFQLHVLALLFLRRIGPLAFFLACLALKALVLQLALPDIVRLASTHALYYGLGLLLGTAGLRAVAIDAPLWMKVLVWPLAAGLLLIQAFSLIPSIAGFAALDSGTIARAAWDIRFLPVAIAGIVATVCLASFSRGAVAGALIYLGRRSMPIFILHILAVSGTRILLTKIARIDDLTIILTGTIIAGLAFPLMADMVFRKTGISKRLGLG